MSRKRPIQVTDEWDGGEGEQPSRKAARYAVPVALAGITALTVGLVPALASGGSPDLPKISAEELLTKIAESDTEQLSGTVKVSTDLGLPSLSGVAGGQGGGMFGGSGERGGEGGSSADPQKKLMELSSGTHTLRVAADGPEKQRVSIVEDAAEYSVIHNADEVWAYDSGSNSAYHATAPEAGSKDGAKRDGGKHERPKGLEEATPQELAKEALKAVDGTTSVKVDGTAKVAGRDAYQLVVEPKQSESTVGSLRIAVDADNGVPLKFTLMPDSGGKPVVDAGFTSVDFAKPAAKTFEFTPPKDAKVTEDKGLEKKAEEHKAEKGAGELGEMSGLDVIGEGWASVVELNPADSKAPNAGKQGEMPAEAEKLLDSLGDKVDGKFGSGRVFSTRLVNVLMTDDGAVYAGAVDKAALVKAANEAAK